MYVYRDIHLRIAKCGASFNLEPKASFLGEAQGWNVRIQSLTAKPTLRGAGWGEGLGGGDI